MFFSRYLLCRWLQGQIRFGSSSSSRGSRHDSSSVTAAYLGGGIGMSWGMDAPLGVPAAANSPPGRHQPSSRRRHRERSRRHARGEEAAGTDAAQDSSSRRHHRHQSRHHRSGRRCVRWMIKQEGSSIGRRLSTDYPSLVVSERGYRGSCLDLAQLRLKTYGNQRSMVELCWEASCV